MMKTFAALLAVLLASSTLSDAAHIHISEKAIAPHEQRSAVTRKQEMFDRIAHMKSTPWDSEPSEKAAKCDDICLLADFWTFQQVRNCVNRPTSLCTPYQLGLSAVEAVITIAECDCAGDNSTSASVDYSGSDE